MNAFRHTVVRRVAALWLFTGLLSGLAAHLQVQQSPSVLGLWLADHLVEQADLSRADVLDAARSHPDKAAFFIWAAETVSSHRHDFSFPEGQIPVSTRDFEKALITAWDSRMQTSGMASSTARIEAPRNWHFEAKALSAPAPARTQTIQATIEAGPEDFDPGHRPAQAAPLSSGIAIGAP